jgi:hypothetical protein
MLNGGEKTFSERLADKEYKSYLKAVFYNDNGILINSGPYDFRTSIGNITKDDTWGYHCSILNEEGTPVTSGLTTSIEEINYNSTQGTQVKLD